MDLASHLVLNFSPPSCRHQSWEGTTGFHCSVRLGLMGKRAGAEATRIRSSIFDHTSVFSVQCGVLAMTCEAGSRVGFKIFSLYTIIKLFERLHGVSIFIRGDFGGVLQPFRGKYHNRCMLLRYFMNHMCVLET